MSDTEETYRIQAKAAALRYLANCTEYTSEFERTKLVNNWIEKDKVAREVVTDFKKRVGDPRGKSMLDFGFGNGQYAAAFAEAGASVSGVEVNQVLVDLACESVHAQGLSVDLRLYDGVTLPFPNNSFDYAYSLSVLEHVSDLRSSLTEIARVLKPGGKFYLSIPNRFRPHEPHTGIWFLGYFPRNVARFVARRFLGSNAVDELNLHFLTYFSIVRAIRGLSLHVCFEYGGTTFLRRAFKRVLGLCGVHFSAVLGTVMVILEKRHE